MRLNKPLLLLAISLLALLSACGTDDYFSPHLTPENKHPKADSSQSRVHHLPDVEILRDGTVQVGTRRFSDITAFHQSQEFQRPGHRCGTVHNFSPTNFSLSGGDCSFNFTSIRPEYSPDALLEIPIVFHVIQRTNGTGHIPEHLIHSQLTSARTARAPAAASLHPSATT